MGSLEPADASVPWLRIPEKGTALGIWATVKLATLAGREAARTLLKLIAAWYTLLHPGVRRASRSWWRRVLGREPTLSESYRHVLTFAETSLDNCFFLQGRGEPFEITRTGHEHLVHQRATGRGAILLSAHLGSTAAMSIGGYDEQLRIRIVGYFKNARMINAALDKLRRSGLDEVVHIEPGSTSSVLAIRERIEAGELLAIAADRPGLGERTVEVEFMGAPATLPAGPFLLAAMLQCPVYFVCGLYRPPNRYALFCEPLADRLELPRQTRQEALREWAQRYAQRLEHYARRAPDNWFNFYDFWSHR